VGDDDEGHDGEALAAAAVAATRGDWVEVAALTATLVPKGRNDRIALAFLRARAALHSDLPAAAIEALDGLAGEKAAPRQLVTRDVLRGRALAALGRLGDATALLQQTAELAQGDARADAQLALADVLIQADRAAEAQRVLDALLSHRPPAGVTASALAIQARAELRRCRRGIAGRLFREALDALGADDAPCAARASLHHALLAIALETLDLRLFAWVRAEMRTARSAIVSARARVFREQLALGCMLLGQLDAAWEHGWAARDEASAGVAALAADLLAAQISRAAGETFSAEQLLTKAMSNAEDVAWGTTDTAGLRVLLGLVDAGASVALTRAQDLMRFYDALSPERVREPEHDDRDLLALAHVARAAVAGARGARDDQISELRHAITRWRSLGHDLGELRATVALAQVTRDAHVHAEADRLSGLVPHSWLRREYLACAARATSIDELTPAEYRVMLLLAEGLTTAAIAARLDRSVHTVRNQTSAVFKQLGVRSRAALVGRCIELRVIPGAPGQPGTPGT
jgi:DNA-binding CsgD family transcriptional regulator